MGIVTTYGRANGSHGGYSQGSSGSLRSTRQKLPYVTGPYRTLRMFIESPSQGLNGLTVKPQIYSVLGNSDSNFGLHHRQRSVERARARLNNTLIKGRAALGITAATANQSFAMIANRMTTLRNAYKAVRTGNVRKLERTLNLRRNKDLTFKPEFRFTDLKLPPRVRNHFNAQVKAREKKGFLKGESAEGLWLEYTFGWVPLVADIGAVQQVLTDPFSVTRSHGTCTLRDVIKRQSESSADFMLEVRTRTVCTAGVKITNPNTALLTQLGLNNPLAVAWDIIPFSFVVDWFFKVSTFLNKWNDMAGFTYVDPVTTINQRVTGVLTGKRTLHGTNAGRGTLRERSIGIVNKPMYPTFVLPTPSLWLAATSSALTLQVFKSRK